METLDALAVALGLGTLAGVNLYLTVFAAGLVIHLGWVNLAPEHSALEVLGEPWIVGIAATLYLLQFFADKIPWVDSLNDAVQTVLRPLGGALLGVLALGEAHPAATVLAALLAGSAALTSHTAKAATRLVVNTSPEPVSNIGLSLGEDAAVLGGLALLATNPLLAALLALLLLLAAWFLLPRLLRIIRVIVWLAWKKLNTPASVEDLATSPNLPHSCEIALRRARPGETQIVEAARCASGGGPRLPANILGWLTLLDTGELYFLAPRLLGTLLVKIPEGQISTSTHFLSEVLEIRPPGSQPWRFQFDRGSAPLAARFAHSLEPASAA